MIIIMFLIVASLTIVIYDCNVKLYGRYKKLKDIFHKKPFSSMFLLQATEIT
jgi:hypothetical protein